MKVAELMSRGIVTVGPRTTVNRLLKLLKKHQISGAPVVDDAGQLLGVVSLTDVVKKSVPASQASECDYYVNSSWGVMEPPTESQDERLVGEIMTRLVIQIDEAAEIVLAADLLTNFEIHRVVVTSGGAVVGMLSSLDLVRAFRDLLKAGTGLR